MLLLVATSKGGMDDLAAVFAKIDVDNSGSLSREEFVVAMDSVELKLVPAEVNAIFAKVSVGSKSTSERKQTSALKGQARCEPQINI